MGLRIETLAWPGLFYFVLIDSCISILDKYLYYCMVAWYVQFG